MWAARCAPIWNRPKPNRTWESGRRWRWTNAFDALTQARTAYDRGENAQVETWAKKIGESVELAETSLHETGKNPRKSPKWFKRAESSTRELLRRLDAFQQAMDVTDRPLLDAVKAKVQQVHDDLLEGVLEGKEK